jgi:hypothetical protein
LFERIIPGMSSDGTYIIHGVVVPGGKQAQLVWVAVSTGLQPAAATNLSLLTGKIMAIGR